MAKTKPEYVEVFNGGGTGGGGLRRLDGHAQVERSQHIRHGYPGVIIATLETKRREDLTTLPEESASWERHGEESPLHHCGHLRSSRAIIVMATGDLNQGRIGGIGRPHTLLYRINGIRVCSKRQFPRTVDPDALPDVHWVPVEASGVIAWHMGAPALETARKQHRELALARASERV